MPDGFIAQDDTRRAKLLTTVQLAFHVGWDHPCIAGAEAWIQHIAPDKAKYVDPDPLALALHTTMLGFDMRYYNGLLRLFQLLGLQDR